MFLVFRIVPSVIDGFLDLENGARGFLFMGRSLFCQQNEDRLVPLSIIEAGMPLPQVSSPHK